MASQTPSLALEMSMDGIALHQFTFDGHWHEMSRIGLSDAALREKMADMREKAAKIQGRKCRSVVWLPPEQIILRNLHLTSDSDDARRLEAKEALAQTLPYAASDLLVQTGTKNPDGSWPVVAAQISTMNEAREFARSHGFTSVSYSTRDPIAGFDVQPEFTLPASKTRIAGFAAVVLVFAALVVAGGIGIRTLNPFGIWDFSPRLEDVAPYRGAGLAPDNSEENILPLGLMRPEFPVFPALASQNTVGSLPYLPPRQLTATALDTIVEPALPPLDDTGGAFAAAPFGVTPNFPAPAGSLAPAGFADSPPDLGPFNAIAAIANLQTPAPGLQADHLFAPLASFAPAAIPATFASIRFAVEPLPPIVSRLSRETMAEIVRTFDIPESALGTATPAIPLLETSYVSVTGGLPPLLPVLRSGREIPPQVPLPAPPPSEIETLVAQSRLFAIVRGTPNPRPLARPEQPEPVIQSPEGVEIVPGGPGFTPLRRPAAPEEQPPTETLDTAVLVEPDETPPAETVAEVVNPDAVEDSEFLPLTSGFAGLVYDTPEGAEYQIVNGLPDRLPPMRSGRAIPEIINASAQNADPATVVANALRPLHRPQSIIDLPAPIDPMMSDAAPAAAFRPQQRTEAFLVNAARIAEIAAQRPRAVAPPVPADPPTVNLPASASVQREATTENAINLRKTNLIGILGTPDSRTVMIRLASGRIISGLHLGESFSGWQIIAIDDTSIRIRRGRREEILRLP